MVDNLFATLSPAGTRILVASLPNPKMNGIKLHFSIHSEAELQTFIARHDVPGRALYFTVATLRDDVNRRLKVNVASSHWLWAEIDFHGHPDIAPEEMLRRLQAIPHPPTMIIASGHGYHAYWQFKEAIDAAPGKAQSDFEEALKLLCAYVGADSGTCDASRLLRLPGSHNSKNGDKLPVEIIDYDSHRTYELSDMVDFLLEAQPIMPAPLKPKTNGHDHDTQHTNDGPVDVDERLATMTFEAVDGTGINATYKKVSPLLLSQGLPWDEAETLWVDAVMAAGMRAGQTWDRVDEIKRTRERFRSTLRNLLLKDYDYTSGEIPTCLPIGEQDKWMDIIREGGRPDIGENRYGLYVRKAQGSGPEAQNTADRGRQEEAKEQPDPPKQKFRFRLISFQDMRPGLEPIYLVDELIPSAGLVLIWGRQKTFKSFWLLDLMLHVAMGWSYRDRDVRQGPVIYCAFEGAHGYKGRIEALRRHYGIADDISVPLFVMPGQTDLIKNSPALIADFRAQLGDVTPCIVVLDTLNRSLRGSENTEDMARYTEAAEAIRAAFNCVVIIVHHCGYDDTHSRGHTSLPAAVDAELEVAREEGSPLLVVAVKHMREGPEGMQVRCRAHIMPLDPDRNGKPRSSIVIIPDDAPGGPVPKSAGRPDHTSPTLIEAIRTALTKDGVIFHPDNKMPLRAVDQEHARKVFYRSYIDGEANQEKSESSKRQAFTRGLKRLIAEGVLRGQNTDQGKAMLWFSNAEVDCP
jgi:hypothetical protein